MALSIRTQYVRISIPFSVPCQNHGFQMSPLSVLQFSIKSTQPNVTLQKKTEPTASPLGLRNYSNLPSSALSNRWLRTLQTSNIELCSKMDCSLSGRNVLTDVVIHSIGGRHRRRPSIGLLDMEGHSTSVAMAITPIFIVDITSSISDDVTYLRNNKAEGEKNVRCFPQCNSDGHCSSSFCGSSIKATLSAAHIGDRSVILAYHQT